MMSIDIEVDTMKFENLVNPIYHSYKTEKNSAEVKASQMATIYSMIEVMSMFVDVIPPTEKKDYYTFKQKKNIKETPLKIFGNCIKMW